MIAGLGGDEDKQDFDQAYAELIDSERIQTEMRPMDPPESPEWLEDFAEWLASMGEWLGPLFSWIPNTGGVGKPLLIIVILLLTSLFLFFLGRWAFDWLRQRQPRSKEEDAVPDLRPDAQEAQSLLGQADALARDGRFAEAAHLLLFRSLEDIEAKLPDFLRPALTGREIAAADALPDEPRSAFGTIAQIVERGIFAERAVDETGWREARQAYEHFAFGRHWG